MFKIQPSFTTCMDFGRGKEEKVLLQVACSARRAQGGRAPLPSPHCLAGPLPLPTSRLSAVIHRALPVCQALCSAHYRHHFLLSPESPCAGD